MVQRFFLFFLYRNSKLLGNPVSHHFYADLLIAVAIGVIFAILQSLKQIKEVITATSHHRVISISESDFNIENSNHESK